MKTISIILVFVLSLNLQSRGQDEPAYMNKSWKDLTVQIQKRNDVASVLLSQLKETKKLDTTVLQKTKSIIQELTVYLREKMTKFDSSSVKLVYKGNQAVSSNLGRTLILLENQPRIRQMSEIMPLLQHLKGTEKRLHTFIQKHNQLASEYRRADLAFSNK